LIESHLPKVPVAFHFVEVYSQRAHFYGSFSAEGIRAATALASACRLYFDQKVAASCSFVSANGPSVVIGSSVSHADTACRGCGCNCEPVMNLLLWLISHADPIRLVPFLTLIFSQTTERLFVMVNQQHVLH
jgi:hypothetical protein